jgi:hypothetical protein
MSDSDEAFNRALTWAWSAGEYEPLEMRTYMELSLTGLRAPRV